MVLHSPLNVLLSLLSGKIEEMFSYSDKKLSLGLSESLGAKKTTIFRKILIPLMTGGLLAGFITSFSTATVELSATIMLVSTETDAPLAYAIYSYMQTAAGRGPGAGFGVIGVLIVAVGTYLSQLIIEKNYKQRGMEAKIE